MDVGITKYQILIEDITNNVIIKEKEFTNTTSSILEMELTENIPTEGSIIEISIKKTGGETTDEVHTNSIVFYLE